MTSAHVSMMLLRRLRAGEVDGSEAGEVQSHAEGCTDCRAKLTALESEEKNFRSEVPLDRFTAGVERAARELKSRRTQSPRWVMPVMAAAAAVLLTVTVGPLLQNDGRSNRIKGSDRDVVLKIGGVGNDVRDAAPGGIETLQLKERVRVGLRLPATATFVQVLSVDETGETSLLYSGNAEASTEISYLPDSIEFTGKGLERLIVVMSENEISQETLIPSTSKAFQNSGRKVDKMAPLDLPGTQFHQLFRKP